MNDTGSDDGDNAQCEYDGASHRSNQHNWLFDIDDKHFPFDWNGIADDY